ncbi:MAG: DUF3667 domain-containing protein [Luteimonas sp.]
MTDTAHRPQTAGDVASPDGHACALCGQPTTARRIDWAFIHDEVRRGALSLERGLLHTLLRLLFQPGRLLRDYLDGHRAGYVKPLWLLLSTAALVTLLNRYAPGVGAFAGSSAEAQAASGADAAGSILAQSYQQTSQWASAHLALATLIVLPLEAACLKLAFWRVRGLNYPEWLTITAYLTAQTFLVWSLGIVLRTAMPDAEAWAMQAAMLYLVASLMLTFRDLAWWNTMLRGIAGLTSYIVAATGILAIALVLFVRVAGVR